MHQEELLIKKRAGLSALAVLGATALALTGCSGNGGGSDSGSGSGSTNANGIVTTNGSEPQNPLIPSNTTETGGGKIITSLFDGLFTYDADGKPVKELAKDVSTDDSKTFDITINTGWKFTNGEEITAESFTKAWNWAAQKSNAQGASYFFENIEGYDAEKDSEPHRPEGRRRRRVHRHAQVGPVGLPAVARLQRLRAAPLGVLRRPQGVR